MVCGPAVSTSGTLPFHHPFPGDRHVAAYRASDRQAPPQRFLPASTLVHVVFALKSTCSMIGAYSPLHFNSMHYKFALSNIFIFCVDDVLGFPLPELWQCKYNFLVNFSSWVFLCFSFIWKASFVYIVLTSGMVEDCWYDEEEGNLEL